MLMLYHTHAAQDVLDELQSSEGGLHQIYAEARLREHGDNHLRLTRRSIWRILIEPFSNTLMLILAVAFILSTLIQKPVEASFIVLIIMLTAFVNYYQSLSHERTLRRLERQAVGSTKVRRDGVTASIDTVELVPGDIVLIKQGDRIPADGRLLHANRLRINLLQLTGQPDPVAGVTHSLHSDIDLSQRHNMAYRGSFVTSGSGQFIVTATGNKTEYGKLLQRAAHITRRSTLLQKIDALMYKIIAAILCIAALLLIVGLAYGMHLKEAVEYAIAIIVAAVPALLVVTMAISMTSTLRRVAAHHALIRDTRVIESISMVSALVSDKTGMLTRDELSVIATWQPESVSAHALHDIGRQTIVEDADMRDSIDAALKSYLLHVSSRKAFPMRTFGFDHVVGMSGGLWHKGSEYTLAVKGAPEKILHLADMTDTEHEQATVALHQLTSKGHTVLAVAHATTKEAITQLNKLPKRRSLTFVGFIAFEQKVRPDVRRTLQVAEQAGISVRMVTGDHIETAYSLAKQIGIARSRTDIFDARKLNVMSDNEVARVIKDTKVIARATTDQKHRLITALKRHHIVAVTGHRSDDMPALSQAHVGISSMSSSTLARDSSDMILLDNKFSSIFEAVRWSRTAIGNIRRMFLFIMTTNTSELMIIVGSLALGMPPILLPVQLLVVNIVTSLGLALPLGLEPHSRNIMKRKPVSPRARILPNYLVLRILILAAVMAAVTCLGFTHYLSAHGAAYAHTIAFNMFLIMQLISALSARSDHTSTIVRFRTLSPFVYLGIVGVIALQTLLMTTSLGSNIGLTAVSVNDALISAITAAIGLLAVSELLKWHSRHTIRRSGRSYE